MAEAFDAYYVWLGIGPEEQPANHYRLLGIRLFEPNSEVIESAADRQMAHLRTFQQGKNAALSQRLLNEVSAARVCLLNPATKAAYDAQLRALPKPIPGTGGATLPRATRSDLPVASPIGSPGQQVTSQAATNWDALIGGDAGPATKRTSTRRLSSTGPRKPNNQLVYIISAAVVVLAAGVGLVIYINGMEGEPQRHDAQPAKHVEAQTGNHDKTSAVANSQGPAQPVAPPRDVMLAIDWPVADREDSRLTIDGKDQPLDAIKLEFPVAPGQHVIQLTRDGFEPIRQTLDIGSQPLPPLAPRWIRKAAVAAADEPMPPGTPIPANGGDGAAATQPMKKLPIPSAAEQAQVSKQLDETYKIEHVADKDRALAEQLLTLADSPGNSPAERYMLFTKAVSLAAGASDFNLAFRGVDSLDAAYDVDGFAMKQKLLADAAKTITTADQVTAVVAAAEQVIDQAVADERYDTALELTATAKKLAESPRAEARFRKEVTERIARRVREIEVIQKAAAVAIEAEATLEKSPDDPAANLTLGRWYCLYKRDWHRGLPLLAKGPDGPFKKLVQLELAVDLTLKPQLELADGWWDVGQKESGIVRDSARLHAGEIYRLQFPNLQPGLKKTAIDQRIKEIDAIVGQTTPHSLADLSDDHLPRTHWDRFDLGNAKLKRKIAHLTKAANEMVTKDAFSGSIDIEVVARTEQNNIRLYGPRGSSVIFNWEANPRELRVTRPDGDDRPQSGSLTTAPVQPLAPNDWHLLRWRITETGMDVAADGKTVFTEQRGYDLTTPGKVAVHAVDSNVDIRHFVVSRAKSPSGASEATTTPEGRAGALPRANEAVVLLTFDKASLFKRDGKQYVRDLSGHGNHGLVSGTELVKGKVGMALSFHKSDDYVECPKSDSLNITNAITVCAWVDVRSWVDPAYVVSKDDWADGGAHGFVLRGLDSGRIDFTIGSGSWRGAKSNNPLELNKWHHLAGTNDGRSSVVYIDGKVASSSPAPGPISVSSYNFRIGRGAFAPDRGFDGAIDELAVFPRALSEQEIQAIYATGQRGQSLATSDARAEARPASPTTAAVSEKERASRSAWVRIINKWSGRYVTVAGSSHENGARIIQSEDDSTPDQLWRFEPAAGGRVRIVNKESGLYLGVNGSSHEDGAAILQWEDDMKSDKYWRIEPLGDGFVQIVNKESGRSLAVSGPSRDNGATLLQWHFHDQPDACWQIEDNEKPAKAKTAGPNTRNDTRPVKQNAGGDSSAGAANSLPRNRWIDVLRLVDTQNDVVRGLWSRDGDEVSCQPEEFSRVKLPVILSGGYDLEVEFTRTGGKAEICLALPVGPTECTVLLSASNGDYSGLEYVDGVDIHNPKNPVVVRPGALENGRRYRLLASVRHFKDGTFSIDVSLDGKPYLPHWQGKPSSLKIYSGWMLPNAGEPGVGALKSAATFHSARLRVVSGEAIPESEYQKPSFGPKIVKARWGGGNNWADVSVPVRRAVDEGKTVFAKRDFLGADPTPGWRKHLEITYETDGQQKSVSIDEDRQWTPQEYAADR